VTQEDQTIDHASPANGLSVGIISGIGPARLVSATTATQSPAIAAPSGYQPPANEAGRLMFAGFEADGCGLAKQCRLDSGAWTRSAGGFEAGGGGGRSLGSVPILTIHFTSQKI